MVRKTGKNPSVSTSTVQTPRRPRRDSPSSFRCKGGPDLRRDRTLLVPSSVRHSRPATDTSTDPRSLPTRATSPSVSPVGPCRVFRVSLYPVGNSLPVTVKDLVHVVFSKGRTLSVDPRTVYGSVHTTPSEVVLTLLDLDHRNLLSVYVTVSGGVREPTCDKGRSRT